MSNKYEIIIYWDNTDNIYIAEVPELPGCMAHGNSEEEALLNVKEAVSLWIEVATENNEKIPQPKGRKLIFA